MKLSREKENAVSPVVGVMLMLVVTIVIAAAVSVFATGITDSAVKTPSAMISLSGVDEDGCLVFMHRGGDSFNLEDVSLVLKQGTTSSPKTYSYSSTDAYRLDVVGSDGKDISPGERFKAIHIVYATGALVDYALIDLNSGNSITSGTITIPGGAKSANSGATPTYVALSTVDSNWNYLESQTIVSGTKVNFYVNAYESDGVTEIKSSTANEAKVIISKSGETPIELTYDPSEYGFAYTFTEAGTYVVTAKVNGVSNQYILGVDSDTKTIDTWKSGSSISVTVN